MTHSTKNDNLTLVIGGTGKTGRRVADRLTSQGRPVRIGSRKGERPFVWEDPGTWGPALDGVGSAYVTYYPDLAFPGASETIAEFSQFAVAHGTRRLVLLSGRGEEGAVASEDSLKKSGADWTVVRCDWFNQNFSESFFLEPVLAGELALPTGECVEPFVDADDIADVAVAALTDDRHIHATYELSGPRLLSFRDVADELSAATGRTITHIPVSSDDYRAALVEAGQPAEFADLFAIILDGRNASLVNGVQEVLDREPRDFSAYARDTAATGVWNA
ncbi:Rossmann-fold NAD(P)-binding domain-containing protein [Streptomyces acidicola]|uniref:NmrA family transcriptional regulator n=1 Tax=Streptomyces acidicola TaxID=2596892 RepID=A0A5N8WRC1_9ACTN|nr:NmrA family transcriptional regulator [Streptomyces acidicola]MPY49376.1 NmrA family transcriptional regulator [Streptomyces acidicola]